VVTSLTKDILTPLIAAIVGKPDFSALVLTINGANISYGNFLNALISFLLVAAAVYYFVITPVNAFMARVKRGELPPDPTTKNCPQCAMEIPLAARKCGFCTSVLA
jgi:large conductance mechanosensitive channel